MLVMVIDMLEGFTRTGPLASPRVDALIPRQAECLRSLPAGSLVVFLADEHESDDFELKRFPPHCLRGTSEANIREELVDAAREAGAKTEIVRKKNFSGFFGTNLDEIVEAAPSLSWILFGCATDCCIEANVAELAYRGGWHGQAQRGHGLQSDAPHARAAPCHPVMGVRCWKRY